MGASRLQDIDVTRKSEVTHGKDLVPGRASREINRLRNAICTCEVLYFNLTGRYMLLRSSLRHR